MTSNEKIAQFVDVLLKISQKGFNVPGLIMSSPGYGKTSTLEMYSKRFNYNLTTLIASQYAPDDILGLQAMKDGHLERMTPSWFNDMVELSTNGRYNILFIDEITTCDEFIQAPLMNLIFTRKLNGRIELPSNTVIIAAGNYAEELNNSFKLSLPIVNRFLILNLRQGDYDFGEIFTNKFASLKDSVEIDKYLGLQSSPDYWNFGKISNYLRTIVSDPRNIKVRNSAKTGLLGFISVRSVDYSLKFLSVFCKNYSSDVWVDVIGDTLGMNSSDIPITNVLRSRLSQFMCTNVPGLGKSGNGLIDLLKAWEKSPQDPQKDMIFEMVEELCKNPENFTDEEMQFFSEFQSRNSAFNELFIRTMALLI